MKNKEKKRCEWAGPDPLYIAYHDNEWGVPVFDDSLLFEFLILEGAQAGLSWLTVLRKRENYKLAYKGFDVKKVARFSEAKIESLLKDPGIIRNRLKVHASVKNAKAFLKIQKEFESFAKYSWDFVGGSPIKNKFRKMSELPALTPEALALSKDLKKRGFSFVGPTIIYAHMQAVGMVNDHTTDCFRYKEVALGTKPGKKR
ncbi:MAG: DNA-3-methyladenine glycosylase I [Thermodesulfobacteriota bacterium]